MLAMERCSNSRASLFLLKAYPHLLDSIGYVSTIRVCCLVSRIRASLHWSWWYRMPRYCSQAYAIPPRDNTTTLQSYACHEHHGRPAAHGGDEGIVVADMAPSAAAEPPKLARNSFRSTSRPKEPPNPEKWPCRATSPEIPAHLCFRQGVFTQPRPKADVRHSQTGCVSGEQVIDTTGVHHAGFQP
jgi:hypothetical protein